MRRSPPCSSTSSIRSRGRSVASGSSRSSVSGATSPERTFRSEAHAVKQKATHLREEPKDFDDQTLKAKVESEVFRPADSPKGDVNVNVENGVVFLRGQVERQELVGELEDRVRKVQGVERVENLLNTA